MQSQFSSQQQLPQQQQGFQKTIPVYAPTQQFSPGFGQQQHPAFAILQPSGQSQVTQPLVQISQLPPVIQENIYETERHEIQPFIERQTETLEVQPLIRRGQETVSGPQRVLYSRLPAERREVLDAVPLRPQLAVPVSGATVQPKRIETVIKPALVRETIQPRVIQEIQPVIERQVLTTTVVQSEKPIIEHYVAKPIYRQPIYESGQLQQGLLQQQQPQQQQQQQQWTNVPSYQQISRGVGQGKQWSWDTRQRQWRQQPQTQQWQPQPQQQSQAYYGASQPSSMQFKQNAPIYGQQQGFPQPQQGFSQPQQGFSQQQQGFPQPQQGFSQPQQGFPQPQTVVA